MIGRLCCALVLASCSCVEPDVVLPVGDTGTSTGAVEEQVAVALPPDVGSPQPQVIDPYEGHENWCEELEHLPCATDSDCPPSKIGVDRRCIEPFWYEPVEDEKAGLCVPVYLGWTPREEREEMNRRKARLFEIVQDRCALPPWAKRLHDEYGYIDCGRVPGRSKNLPVCLERRYCDPYKLDAALRVVVKREADWRQRKAHNLQADVEASRDSWLRMCKRGIYEGNPHFGACVPEVIKKETKWHIVGHQWKRWRTYGYFGQISSYRVFHIDAHAPPEIMCHEVYQTEAYLRALRRAWHKYDKGLDCNDAQGRLYNRKLLKDKKQKRDGKVDTWPQKTWYTLHRAASSGSLCPRDPTPERQGVKTRYQYYSGRMDKVGMDPDEEVTLRMLGNPLPDGDAMHVQVRRIMTQLDENFPPPGQ